MPLPLPPAVDVCSFAPLTHSQHDATHPTFSHRPPQSAGDVAGYVALSSVATCIGCILGGHLGEAALDPTIGVPRPFCLSPMFLLMALGALGVAFGPGGLLYLNVFLTMFGARRKKRKRCCVSRVSSARVYPRGSSVAKGGMT